MKIQLLLISCLMMCGCALAAAPQDTEQDMVQQSTDAFWQALASHCGNAYAGKRVQARNDRPDLLVGDEQLVVHFRHCDNYLLALPFHIGKADGSWDRSRTWRFSRLGSMLELRHDHRLADGQPDTTNTMYGGLMMAGGSNQLQRFLFTERTAEDGSLLGWQIEIVPGKRYTYGTFSGDNWTWRLDFDLSKPLDKLPPAPWGHQ
ncbi:hypothetical protein [Arsukibacterium sp.]|uniref:hypothetical protein n=1 Tax=Arsukibacterium sp. TaxID=1977258 RepID=UPI002FDB6CA3